MFLSKKGKLYAEVQIHCCGTGRSRIVNCREECNDDTEKFAYDECVSNFEVIKTGEIIAEPLA